MSTLVRRQPLQPRARFAPRSPPRFARRAPASPAQARDSPFADALTRRCTVLRTSASAHCADFCALPIAMLPALVRALLRSPPALRSSLPRAVRSAPSATQSPWRLRSAGFTGVNLPIFHTARIAYPTGRAGLGFHTPRSRLQGGRMRPLCVPFADLRRLWPPGFCWSERMSHRYTPNIVALTAQGGSCRTPTCGRNATEHGINTDRYTTDIRRSTGVAAPLPAFSMTDTRRRSRNSRLGIALEDLPSSAPRTLSAPPDHRCLKPLEPRLSTRYFPGTLQQAFRTRPRHPLMTASPSDPGHEILQPSAPTLETMSSQGVRSTLAQASRAAETIENLAGRVAVLSWKPSSAVARNEPWPARAHLDVAKAPSF